MLLLRREGVGGVLGIGRRRKRNGNEMERKHLPTFLSYFFAGGKKVVPPKVGTTTVQKYRTPVFHTAVMRYRSPDPPRPREARKRRET